MARTGTGTRRPRAKTTGTGAKDADNAAEMPVGVTSDQSDKSPTPESGPSMSEAPATGSDTLAGPTTQPVSEGAVPEKTAEGTETQAEPAKIADAEPTPEPPIASMTEPAEPARAASPPPPPVRRGGLVPLVLGGVVAAAIGAGAVLALFPQGWQPADTAAVEARLAALETRESPIAALSPLEERIAALENAAPDLRPLEERLAALEAGETATRLEQRVAQLEGNLAARIEEGIDSALEEARDRQAERAQAIEDAEQDLASTRAQLEARAALAELAAAAETGQPAPDALPALATVTDLPPALSAFSDGLPQLRNLQASFAGAARDALAAAPLDEGRSTGDRVLNFLRSQTGARSLTPREGNDTDAILSRAEAHVRAADLPAALTELDTLPDGPAAAMADWRAQVETRLNALAALAEVQSRMNNQ